jgi:two-component system cell cycle sensor histidine kinase/response regulator CckA
MSGNQHTILVAEDEELLRDLLKEFLEEEGYNVLTARDGFEAVEIYKRSKDTIALVLSDMGLPGIGGWEVFRQIRQITPDVKVILSSGFLDSSVREEMIRAGAKDFIQKPYVADLIIAKIRDILAGT